MVKKKRDLKVVIEQDSSGMFIASVPELKNCKAEAQTMEEVQELIKLAIKQSLGDKDASVDLEERGQN